MFRIFPFLLSALLFQLPLASTIIVTKSDGIQTVAPKQDPNEHWTAVRVLAAGGVEPLKFHVTDDLASGSLGRGATEPKPSPDGQYIAFVRKRNLWLWDSQTNKEMQITAVGSKPNKRYKGVLVLTTDWSPDSREVLYYVTEDVEGDEPPFPNSVRRAVEYGFHVYNVESRRSRKVNIPRTGLDDTYPIELAYQAWLPNGAAIVTNNQGVAVVDMNSGSVRNLVMGEGFAQISVSRAGNFLVSTVAPIPGDRSDIVKVNIQTGETVPLAPRAGFAELQWPTVSPSGSHICYMHMVPQRNAAGLIVTEETSVICDNKPIFEVQDQRQPSLHWIDDATAAIVIGNSIVISDIVTGREINRYQIPTR